VLTYAKLKHDRRKFLALTGLTPKEFQLLLPAFEHAYQRRYPLTNTRWGKVRRRPAGGGRKSNLDRAEQKLLFALVYLKAYPLQTLLGEVFDLSQSRTNRGMHELLPMLQPALADLGVRPERHPRQFVRHERKQGEPLDLSIDGTDRRRQRPNNKAKQDDHYRGRKKTHADKNLIIAHRNTKRIGFLSQTDAGKVQDKKMADTERIVYPRGARLGQDAGFQAYEPRGVETYHAKKNHGRAS
jgi:DDE superfamily endonuclease